MCSDFDVGIVELLFVDYDLVILLMKVCEYSIVLVGLFVDVLFELVFVCDFVVVLFVIVV